MNKLKKLLFVASLILFPSFSFAEDIVLVKYEEVKDCKVKPVWVCVVDNDGQTHCIVKQEGCDDGVK